MSTTSTIRTANPARPAEVVAEVPVLTPSRLDEAVSSGRRASTEWALDATGRSTALTRWAESIEADASLAELLAREVGKPILEARSEIARSVAILRYYAQAAYDSSGELFPSPSGGGELRTERLPLGLVLLITPWNFPAAIPIWKMAPALAYGNTVILKPSSAAVGTAERLLDLGHRHLTPEVLQLAVIGSTETRRLVDDERIDAVSFTGSAEVGRMIIERASSRGAPVQAEMGGQNASLVLDDADIEFAAETIAGAAMAYAGQKCTATSRVVVTRSVSESFIRALTEAVRGMPVGDPLEDGTLVGPLINAPARDAVTKSVVGAVNRGASILTGGKPLKRDGWFYDPALVRVHSAADPFVQEETFGPAAAILIANDDEEAVTIANSTRFGLSAAVFGRDMNRATAIARRMQAGLVRINASTTGVDFYAPFGGNGESSYGPREQGRAAREFYTKTRTVLIHSRS